MHYSHILLQDYLQNTSLQHPQQTKLEAFRQSVEEYLKQIAQAEKESEEHLKNILRDFLSQTFAYTCNTKDRIDLAIYEDSCPKVLFETKSLSASKDEFISGGGHINLYINLLNPA